jgi:hypothetical protein
MNDDEVRKRVQERLANGSLQQSYHILAAPLKPGELLPPHPLDDEAAPVVKPRVERAECRRLRWELEEAEGGGEEGAAAVSDHLPCYRVSLREIDAWVASFRRDPMVSDAGFASAATPWEAVQLAAWAAVRVRRAT